MKVCPACSREYGDEHESCRDDGAALVCLDTGAGGVAQDLIGQVVDGRYRIERIVGRGGMGTIYACRHVVVGKSFAIKVLRTGIERSEEILQRFIREAQAANAVRSRHICTMSDFGQLPNGAFYVVMDLLDGISLTRALREQRLERQEIERVFIQIAETLERAHQARIVHRDLKPDNVVLVSEDDDPYFVKLVDFGIAKMLQHQASNLTETGVILGTPYYMSPEQARGDEVDHRSDIYALGVMMYRAFAGRLPFVADTAMGVLTRHLTEKPERPSRLADVAPPLERLILRCLEKKPIDRFQSMADVAAALRAVASGTPSPSRHDATVDERSGALAVVVPPDGAAPPHSTPPQSQTKTRMLTPSENRAPSRAAAGMKASPANEGGAPVDGDAARQLPSAAKSPSIPPPLPAPTPAAMAATTPPAAAQAWPAPGTAAAARAAAPQLGLAPGEAATHRGLVSSRLDSPISRMTPRRTLLWAGLAALMAVVGASAAFAVFSPAAPAPATTSRSATAATAPPSAIGDDGAEDASTAVNSDAPRQDDDSAAAPATAASTASASAATSARAPTAASATPSAGRSATPRHHPPPPVTDKPPPEIRSPFD